MGSKAVDGVVRQIDGLKERSKQHNTAAPPQLGLPAYAIQAQLLYEQVLTIVQGSYSNINSSSSSSAVAGNLTCTDLSRLASRLPVLMQLLGRVATSSLQHLP
jgi:hypothetical protein